MNIWLSSDRDVDIVVLLDVTENGGEIVPEGAPVCAPLLELL